MAKYRVGVIERYERLYVVEAIDEEDALNKAASISENDEGNSFEYHSTTPKDTWNVFPVKDSE